MKNCLMLIVVGILLLVQPAGGLYGQDPGESSPAVEASSTMEIATADAEGIVPSIVVDGPILNFLKLVSVATNKNIVPSSKVRGDVSASLFNVTYMEAIDVILSSNGFAYEEDGPFIFVYTKKELDEIKAAARKTVSQMFPLNYIAAKDARSIIEPLKSDVGIITVSPEGSVGAVGTGSGENWAGSNFIIVNDYPEYIAAIEKALKFVDKRPSQVLIEATILVATLNDENKLGIDFNVLGGVDFETQNGVLGPPINESTTVSETGSESSTDASNRLSGTTVQAGLTNGALSVGVVKGNIGVFINALETVTDVVTLGNPKILTLNRQEGEIIVGNETGYIDSTETTSTASTSSVKFLKTGVQLNFTPYVMDDGYIRMELNPEDSDGGLGAADLPFKKTTEVTTNVLVKDGHTIVIGGLFRESTSLGRSQVPLAGNIPLLGQLFKSTTDRNTKEEVVFLITPRIVKDEVDYAMAEEVIDTCNRLMLGAREGMIGLSRDRIATAHYRRAREDQEAGRPKDALWNASLAVHASPTFLDALRLQDELRAEEIYANETGSMREFMRRLIELDKENL